jgi:predicted kinase
MQKWTRDRRRRKKKPQPASAEEQPQDQQPLQPANLEETRSPEPAAQQPAPADEASVEKAATTQRSPRPRRRRRKKPQPQQPQPEVQTMEPLRPMSMSEEMTASVPIATETVVDETAGIPESAIAEPAVEPEPPPSTSAQTPQAKKVKGAVVLSVGLPGSGKSTWFKRHGVTPLSSDMVRQLLFDNPTEQHHQDLVFSCLRFLLRSRLMARIPWNYVDATNLSPKERRHWIKMAREFNYEVHAVYFDVPLETCMARNQKRQRVVPDDVMHRMANKLRPPTFEEGFTKITVVRVKQRE